MATKRPARATKKSVKASGGRARPRGATKSARAREPNERAPAASRPRHAEELARVFAALGDATRLTVAMAVAAEGGVSLAHAAAAAGVSRQAVTKHLEVLERAGVFTQQRRRRGRSWTACPERLEEASAVLAEMAAGWRAAEEARRARAEGAIAALHELLGRA